MKTVAAVLVEPGRPLELAELDVAKPGDGQVLVEIAYSGACHTQLLEVRGRRGPDPWCPHCLGHEGTGKVIAIGPNVSKVAAGDEVVLSWIKGRGADVPGARYDWNGATVNAGGVTTFGRHCLVSENRLTPMPSGIDTRDATLLGCAAPTGFGTVINICAPDAGQSMVVFGMGGVGLCAVAAAIARRCSPVVAVDVLSHKLELAKRWGVTDIVDASAGDPLEAILARIPGGADFAIEATGRSDVMSAALACVRPRGGTAVIIGNAPAGERLSIDPHELNQGKRLVGSWGGNSDPDRDTARYADIISDRAETFRSLFSEDYSLAHINRALDDLEAGRVGRPLINMALT